MCRLLWVMGWGDVVRATEFSWLIVVLSVAALMMRQFNAHGATDIAGYGLLGHAQSLAKIQMQEVDFVIHNLPVIAKMANINKVVGNIFNLTQGQSPETSGRWEFTAVISKRNIHVQITT